MQNTFINPRQDAFGGALKKSAEAEFTIVGIPCDVKSTNRKGAAGGPDAIRAASSSRSINSFTEAGVDLAEDTSIIDSGDISVVEPFEKYISVIEEKVRTIVEGNSIPVVLGGDHAVTYPVIKGLRAAYETINVVWLDSHPDIYPEYNKDKYSHACPLARILELGGIDSVHQGGIRASTRDLNHRLESAGVKVFAVNELDYMRNLSLKGKTYITVDIDVLDPSFAPGVGSPAPGGISTRDLINLIHSFDLDIIGFDVVEVNPDYDHAQITAAAAAKIVMETIGSIVSHKKQ